MKHKVFETVLALIACTMFTYYLAKGLDKEELLTDRKCCAITIDRANKLITYSERNGDTFRRVLGPDNEKEIINMFNDYCTKNHDK